MAKHISNIKIEAFRGIRELSIENFSDVNIFVGDNNSGKTSVLEMMSLLSQPNDMGRLVKLAVSRRGGNRKRDFIQTISTLFKKEKPEEEKGFNNMRDIYSLSFGGRVNGENIQTDIIGNIIKKIAIEEKPVNDFDDENTITSFDGSIKMTFESKKPEMESFSISSKEPPELDTKEKIYNAMYMGTTVSLYQSCVTMYSDIIKNEQKDEFISLLKIFDKGIEDISLDDETLWIHNKNKNTMPLFSYGSGMQKALLMSIVITMAKNGVALIDEIETAIHINALEEVFKFMIKACSIMKVQLFVSTHSIEAVDAMLYTQYDKEKEIYDPKKKDSIRVIRLRYDEEQDKTWARIESGSEAFDDRINCGMELRV